MRLIIFPVSLLTSFALLTGCAGDAQELADDAPLVRVAYLEPAKGAGWSTSGTVRAQIESPLAFRVPGQILHREVWAGDRVRAGQPLMSLDPQDLQQQLAAAQAQLNSARAQAENAVAERERSRTLLEQKLISVSAYDHARTAADEALQRVAAAEADLARARNAADYATLEAPADGVLLEVMADPGQVVAAGQAVAMLAQEGPREVEVFVPQERRAALPKTARLVLGQRVLETRLRELAAAADPVTRTWRARYQIVGEEPPGLGQIVRLYFDQAGAQGQIYRVPLGALSERGKGAQLWVVHNEQVQPEPVQVLRMDEEQAWVSSELPVGTPVVALGTHLLTAGQEVRMAPSRVVPLEWSKE